MSFLLDGDIIPGVSIGTLRLGMTRDEVRARLSSKIKTRAYPGEIWNCPPVQVWFSKEAGTVTQILVEEGFQGKISHSVGIGTSLTNATKILGGWREHLDQHYFENAPFTSFAFDDLTTDEDELDPNFHELDWQIVEIAVGLPAGEGDWGKWIASLPERAPLRKFTKPEER